MESDTIRNGTTRCRAGLDEQQDPQGQELLVPPPPPPNVLLPVSLPNLLPPVESEPPPPLPGMLGAPVDDDNGSAPAPAPDVAVAVAGDSAAAAADGGAAAAAAAAAIPGRDAPQGQGLLVRRILLAALARRTERVLLRAWGFQEAANHFEDVDDRRPICHLHAVVWEDDDDDDDDDDNNDAANQDEEGDDNENDENAADDVAAAEAEAAIEAAIDADNARAFPRFVTLLGQPSAGQGREVRDLHLSANWSRLPADDVERLFKDGLPNLPSTRDIFISGRHLDARFVRMLTAGIQFPLELTITNTGADPTAVAESCAAMLRRNAPVTRFVSDIQWDPDDARRICQAVRGNTNLRTLDLCVSDVLADTLDGVAASTSLKVLAVMGSFSEGSLPSLARQLKTNDTLETLSLRDFSDGDPQALLDVLKTYNYTLRNVDGDLGTGHDDATVQAQFREYERRNQRIRDALTGLQKTHEEPEARTLSLVEREVDELARAGHLGLNPDSALVAREVLQRLPYKCRRESMPTHLVPKLLGRVSDLPKVLYSVLKLGYVNDVAYHLAKTHVVNEPGDGGQPENEGQQLDDDDNLRSRLPQAENIHRAIEDP